MGNIIDNLPIKYKELIHMKYMLGLSYEEISKKLLQKEKGKLKGKE
ncbi:sigma factor-like helix-turn-helix DNA-binding protein [Clostridium tagluense]|uniref:RNA polymerase sigma factor 70 region 4 type 2 domain-containing protein n=1 Tax=Clostridium tagluense TaxID=360422 RepID=A0A401UUG8_9CLOT|nr:hypothetical protein Ctaglu_47590 [Clostridium tagluense]